MKMDKDFLFSDENTERVYHFVPLEKKTYNFVEDKDIQALLMKWSMKDQLKIKTHSFIEQYNEVLRSKFVKDFFDSPGGKQLYSELSNKAFTPMGKCGPRFEISPVPCTTTSLDIFDPLLDPKNGIVRGDEGSITKCMDEDMGEFIIADELQKMLLDYECENHKLLPKNVSDEFIFKLFGHLVVGGKLCQYEDNIHPYITTTKAIYKDLISLYRMKDSAETRIVSKVWQIQARDEAGAICFPQKSQNPQNFVYFIVEPMKRELITFIHAYGGSFPTVH